VGAAKALCDRAQTQDVDLTTLPRVDTPLVGDWTQVQGVGPTDLLRAVVAHVWSRQYCKPGSGKGAIGVGPLCDKHHLERSHKHTLTSLFILSSASVPAVHIPRQVGL